MVKQHLSSKKFLVSVLTLTVVAIILVSPLAYKYFASAASIRNPEVDHYHFRTQLFVDGEKVDFSRDKYQTPYEKGVCSATIPEQPIHFHDNVDQMTHIHWRGITGGMLLKNYGWDFVGGANETLGYRFDESQFSPKQVSIHGDTLPEATENNSYYVYISSDDGYEQKEWVDFLNQDLETFFGKTSNLNQSSALLDWLMPRAYADDGEEHADLERINNLIGDVAIFAQSTEPTDSEVTAAFAGLIELDVSTCGG